MRNTLLFDLDGTLLDTTEFILGAIEHSMKINGHTVPDRSIIRPLVGTTLTHIYQILSGKEDTQAYTEAHFSFQKDNLHLVVPYEGVISMLQDLKSAGYSIAVITNRKSYAQETIDNAGMQDYLDTTVTLGMTPEHKPHPAPLLFALSKLDKTPDEAIMIGDSFVDVEAGKNAGTKTIRVTYGFTQEKLHDPKPDMIATSIKELQALILG